VVNYFYRPQPAVSLSGVAAEAGVGSVYAMSDTSFATPLTVTIVSSGAPSTVISVSEVYRQTEAFIVADHGEVMWKSGAYTCPLVAWSSLVADSAASAAAAAASVVEAQGVRTEAVATTTEVAALRRWIELGVTQYNQVTNPAPTSVTGWRVSGGETMTFIASDEGAGAIEAVDPVGGGSIYADPSASWARYDNTQSGLTNIPGLTEGKWVAFGVDVKALDATTALGVNLLRLAGYSGATVVGGTSANKPLSQVSYTRVTHAAQVTALPDAAFLRTLIWPGGGAMPAGGGFRFRRFAVVVADTEASALAAVSSYWDGDSQASQSRGYAWEGAPDASRSMMIDMTVIVPEGVSADWGTITGKPGVFPPAAHSHTAADISSGTFSPARLGTGGTGGTTRYLREDGTFQVPPGTGGGGSGSGAWSDITGKPTTFPPSTHSHPASQISDSSPLGRTVLTTSDQTTARQAIGAGTSSVTVGGSSSGAAAPLAHSHTKGDVGLGSVDNTADSAKPVSVPQAAALALKADSAALAALALTRAQIVVVQTGNEARPSGSTVVLWVGGSTEPVNLGNDDIWLSEAA
jgi:hypothetical protein